MKEFIQFLNCFCVGVFLYWVIQDAINYVHGWPLAVDVVFLAIALQNALDHYVPFN